MGLTLAVIWSCIIGGFGFTLTHPARRSPPQGRCASKAQWTDEETIGTNPKRSLHPLVDVLKQGYLAVGDGHELYYQVRGKHSDLPMALWLHGGPGAGCYPNHARFCDPALWRVTLVDQRGCGRSKPTADLTANTTPHLIADLEKLRREVNNDEPWACVIGGSWGSTLTLAYAQRHPASLLSMVLRGVCAMRTNEIRWLFSANGGAAALAPHGWASFARLAEGADQDDDDGVLLAYYDMLRSEDAGTRLAAARSWQRWEFHASAIAERRQTVFRGRRLNNQKLLPPGNNRETDVRAHKISADPTASYLSRLEAESRRRVSTTEGPQPLLTCHYSVHRGFLENENAVLLKDNLDKIRHIPAIAVQVATSFYCASAPTRVAKIAQGGADVICPARTAFELSAEWPELELRLVPGAAHSQYDPDIRHEILEATDAIAKLLSRSQHTDHGAPPPLAPASA